VVLFWGGDAANGEMLWLFRKDEGMGARMRRVNIPAAPCLLSDGNEERILYVTSRLTSWWRWMRRPAWPSRASAKMGVDQNAPVIVRLAASAAVPRRRR